jgi:beta/gamma crystallin
MVTLKHLLPKALFGAVALVVGLAAASTAQERGTINVFNDVNYQGESRTFTGDVPNLTDQGWNDRISSLQVAPGEAWEVCVDANFAGRCQLITSNVADVRRIGLNDQISSIRRIDNRNGYRNRPGEYGTAGTTGVTTGVRVFTGPNFRGQNAVLNGDTADLRTYNLNDRLRSIEVPNGETWEVCRDINFGGGCRRVSGSISDLQSIGLGDISSLRRIDGNNRYGRYNQGGYNDEQGLVFFNEPGFRGASRFIPFGSSRSGFEAWDGSLQVRGGGAWEVCDEYGDCETVTRDVDSIYDLGLSGPVVSVRSLGNSRFRRFFRR